MQSPVVDIVEGGARRKARKACPKGKVRGSKSKRCHFRRKSGPHRKSAPSSARRLRGGEFVEQPIVGGSVPAVEPILTAGALEEAFQAGLEAGRTFRGGLEAAPVEALAGGEVVDLEAGARKMRKARKSHRKSAKKSGRKSAKKSHKKSHRKSAKKSHKRRASRRA